MNKSLILCVVFFCALMCFSGTNTLAQAIPAGSLLIAEIHVDPTAPNGDPTGEYFIICNRTAQAINLQGLIVADNSGSTALPNYSLASGACVAFVNNATVAFANFGCAQPSNAVSLNVGNGFANTNDRLSISNTAANGSTLIDGISYGTDTTFLNPGPAAPAAGRSLRRSGYPGGSLVDNDNSADFTQTSTAVNPCTVGSVMAAPSAASVTITGRVISSKGRGIRNVLVRLSDESGESRTVVTSTFGYFRFTDVPAGQTYVISASAKRYTFSEHSHVRSVFEDTADLIFVADN